MGWTARRMPFVLLQMIRSSFFVERDSESGIDELGLVMCVHIYRFASLSFRASFEHKDRQGIVKGLLLSFLSCRSDINVDGLCLVWLTKLTLLPSFPFPPFLRISAARQLTSIGNNAMGWLLTTTIMIKWYCAYVCVKHWGPVDEGWGKGSLTLPSLLANWQERLLFICFIFFSIDFIVGDVQNETIRFPRLPLLDKRPFVSGWV